jgi:hypothetical protein
MVLISLPAHVECDHDGCSEVQNAVLCLTVMGGFAFKPDDEHWQVTTGPAGVFMAYCPMHKRKLQVGPSGPRIITVEGK